MKNDSQFHNRKSIRLKGYDYSRAGLYFITICTKDSECLFGKIENCKMILNDIGKIANDYWLSISSHFPNAILHEYIVMPNHLHGIIELQNNAGTRHGVSLPLQNEFGKSIPGSLSVIINQYKSSVKRWCNKNNCKYFLWQSRFYERIIRNEQSCQTISNYIINNPAKWNEDKFVKK